ncbi:unnamed protein product, partial [Sphenostylis stenocarpa]
MDSYCRGVSPLVPSTPFAGTSSSKGTKRKVIMIDVDLNAQLESMSTGIYKLVDSIDESNKYSAKLTK